MFPANFWFRTESVKFKMYLSCSSKCSIKSHCYIYLEARSGISHREDFRIKDRIKHKGLKSQEQILTLHKIPLKVNMLGFFFSSVAGLHLQTLLQKKNLLRYIFKTLNLRTSFSLKNM